MKTFDTIIMHVSFHSTTNNIILKNSSSKIEVFTKIWGIHAIFSIKRQNKIIYWLEQWKARVPQAMHQLKDHQRSQDYSQLDN